MNIDLYYIRHNKNKPSYSLPRTKLPAYDLTIVLRGSLDYKINKNLVTIEENEAIFLAPGTFRTRFEVVDKADFISFNFFYDGEISLPQHLTNIGTPEILSLISVCDSMDQPFEPLQKSILQNTVKSIILAMKRTLNKRSLNKVTKETLLYIQNHYREKLSITQICEQISYSPTHCSRTFKKDMGKSIIDYLTDLKIQRAKSLILEDRLSLNEIAVYVGYDDYTYFSHIFKDRVGCSPLHYLKSLEK